MGSDNRQAGPILGIDTGSPRISVAVVQRAQVIASESSDAAESSARLLGMVQSVLGRADLSLAALGGVVALRGPGRFTGLRVGLATVLGLHQALGVPATALPTLQVLAQCAAPAPDKILAAVDAHRGEWFVQSYRGADPPLALSSVRKCKTAELANVRPCTLVGFGLDVLESVSLSSLRVVVPPDLASTAAQLAATHSEWDPAILTQPLYLQPPSVTLPKR